jgi:hypothetical protein
MHVKEFSARVVTFKLAAALEKYEMDLHALADPWFDPERFRRVQQQFGELRILGASLPRLTVSWVAVLVSRTKLLHALAGRTAPAAAAMHEHLAAVAGLRARCLRLIGAQGVVVGA